MPTDLLRMTLNLILVYIPDGLAICIFLEAISKNGFWFKVEADARFKPEEYASISRI